MRRSKQLLAFLAFVLCALGFAVASATAEAPQVTTPEVSEVSYAAAHVKAELDPKGEGTSWFFEVSTDGTNWDRTNVEGLAEGSGLQTVEGDITSLNFGPGVKPGTTYQVRLSASNESGSVTSPGPNPEFTTKSLPAPTVSIDPVTTLTGTTATFSGTINPNSPAGSPSAAKVNWHFQCATECPNLSTASSPTPNPVPADTTDHAVSADATGLEPNTTYEVTLIGKNAGDPVEAGPVSFKTTAAAPLAETVPAFALEGGTEALLGGRVNPRNSATTYWIEYGTTTGYGNSVPLSEDASAGSGGTFQTFSQTIAGLTPSTVYHFRVVAENAVDKATGADKSFETAPGPAAEPSCPNSALRVENHSTALPECRSYEQVSPVDKNGFDPGANFEIHQQNYVAANDGSAVFFQSFGGFGDAKTSAVLNQYLARRGSEGWKTIGLTPAQKIKTLNGGFPQVSWLTPDLRFATVEGGQQGHLAPGDNPDISNGYRLDTLTGTYETLAAASFTGSAVGGGTADGSRIFFESQTPLTAEAVGAVTGRGVYEWHEGELKLVSILPNGEPSPDGFFKTAAGTLKNEISADGSRVVFKAADANNQLQLYLREDGVRTLKVSASRGGSTPESELSFTVYAGASADGSKIFFQTIGNLTPDATGEGGKLYRFEPETETLTNLTAGALPGSSQDLTGHGTAGSAVAGISEDGEYVYFYSPSRFHLGDNQAGGSGLYVWHNGTVRFIAPDDGSMDTDASASRVSPDGQLLSFTSTARMTAYDNTDTVPGEGGASREDMEVYTYDFAKDRLTCVSCNPTGQRPTGAPNGGPGADSELPSPPPFQVLNFQQGIRDDGTVFFSSRDALVAQDVNGKMDVYEWRDGRVRLISSGSDGNDSFLASSSATGEDVFFLTRERLVASDRDDVADIYDARVGGGFPQAVPPSLCEGIEGCQGPASNPPPFDAPASGSFSSPLKRLDPRAQRLRKALKACKHKQKKKARARCRAAAKKRFGKASKGRTH